MQDRVVSASKAGRVKITPESGGSAYYAKLEMADDPSQAGTQLRKTNLLKDSTANLYGLTNAAVPDDVLVAAYELISTAQTTADGRTYVESGSYIGTGGGSPSFVVSFNPSLVLINGCRGVFFVKAGYGISNGRWDTDPAVATPSYSSSTHKVSLGIPTQASASAANYLNTSGTTYYFLAFA